MDLARQAQNRRIANRPVREFGPRKDSTGNGMNFANRAYRQQYGARTNDNFESESESKFQSKVETEPASMPTPTPYPSDLFQAIHRDYSYDCLVGNIPNFSASDGAVPSVPLLDNMFTYNTTWHPLYPFNTLRRTAYEFREQMLTPQERMVALPWEIKKANKCTITHRVLRDLWLERYNEQFSEEAARCKSAVVEETKSGDEDESTVPERRVQSQPVAEWEVIRARMKQAADNMRRLAEGKPDPVMDRLANGPEEQTQEQPKPEPLAQPLKIVGRTPPPRAHWTTALGFAESGLEQYHDCGCGPLAVKCARCNTAAVCDAMEDVF